MQKVKLDPIAYVLLAAVLSLQLVSYFRKTSPDAAIEANDDIYQRAVYEDPDSKGVMHQVFRQNEVERELLKAVLRQCGG